LQQQRIATSYPALLSQWLAKRGIDASVVTLSGSVEIAPRLGQADAICDLVSSGATLVVDDLGDPALYAYLERRLREV
jgi:ATP phosphoribosyltransferase